MYRIPRYQVQLVREGSVSVKNKRIEAPETAIKILQSFLSGTDRENFVVMLLDTKNVVIGINVVSVGSLTSTAAHPREVFKPAILSNANSIIIAHNHPSGDPSPSEEDTKVTNRLVEGGKLLGIEVLDHIIIGDGTERSFSYQSSGFMGKALGETK